MNDLGSQLKFAIDTPKEQRAGTQTNATWVEWLMGFPCGWTMHDPLPSNDQKHSGWAGGEPNGVPRLIRSNKVNTARLHLLGNACVPQQAEKGYEILRQRFRADATRARLDFQFLTPELMAVAAV